jgi:signal transduction histidine kinase
VAALEHRQRATGARDFRVWPDTPRSEYHSILYLEPLDARNAAAIGYDMATEPTRREAMERARDEGQAVASSRVTLVQEIDQQKQAGFLVYLPLYRGGGVPPDLAGRAMALEGFVYAPLRVDDLLRGVRGPGTPVVDYALYDSEQASPAGLLRAPRTPADPEATFTAQRTLRIAGRTWLLRFHSTPQLEALSQRRLLPWLGGASLVASLLLAWIAWVQARARQDAEEAAAQRRRNEAALQASEERARERAERLEQLAAQLRESDRRKDEFLAVLAHELRNPLAPVRSALEVLERVPEGPKAQRARQIARRQVAQMVRLIDDLLDVSRISRGKIVLRREPARLAEVVEGAIEASRPLIEARGHRLVRVPGDPDLVLDIDAARVSQILTNLLNNAATYTPPGGEIRLAVAAGGHEVRIAVRDNGMGIPAEKLRHVFEMFAQAQPSPAGGGLGIGLSLASRLAELHGGRIEASSEGEGRGSEFVLVLPRGLPDLPSSAPPLQ